MKFWKAPSKHVNGDYKWFADLTRSQGRPWLLFYDFKLLYDIL